MITTENFLSYSILIVLLLFTVYLYITKRKISFLFIMLLQAFSIVFFIINEQNQLAVKESYYQLVLVFSYIFPFIILVHYCINDISKGNKNDKVLSKQSKKDILKINDCIGYHRLRRHSSFKLVYSIRMEKLMKEAYFAFRHEDESYALGIYRSLYETYHKDPFTAFNYGFVLFRKGYYHEAFKCFLKANIRLRLRKKNNKTKRLQAVCYYNSGNCFFMLKRYKEAASCYQKAISLNSGIIRAKENYVITLLQNGMLKQALSFYDESIKNHRKAFKWTLYRYLADYYTNNNEIENAISSILKARTIRSNLDIETLYIKLLYKSNKHDDVITLSHDAKLKYPDVEVFPFLLGLSYYKKEDFKNAKIYFEKCKNNMEAKYNLAYIEYKNKDYQSSLRILENEKYNKQMINWFKLLAVIYIKLGRYFEAKNIISKAIKDHPRDLKLNFNLGIVYYKLNDYILSKKQFEKCLRINDKDVEAAYYLTKILIVLKEKASAKKIINKYKDELILKPNMATILESFD